VKHDRDPSEIVITQLSSILCGSDANDVDRRVSSRAGDHATPEQLAEQLTAGTVDDHIGRFRALGDAGVEEVIVSLADVGQPGAVESFAPVIAAFA
jgi:hypothetical protein